MMFPPLFVVRHCEPTGRTNVRPMTSSAKQSIFVNEKEWIASSLALLAMAALNRAPGPVRYTPPG
jgi:hypothetical protein